MKNRVALTIIASVVFCVALKVSIVLFRTARISLKHSVYHSVNSQFFLQKVSNHAPKLFKQQYNNPFLDCLTHELPVTSNVRGCSHSIEIVLGNILPKKQIVDINNCMISFKSPLNSAVILDSVRQCHRD